MAASVTSRPDEDALRALALSLASDKTDRAEAAQVLRDMETLRAW